ncbi:hypothetical protein ACFQPA_14635 [Halomarina halobia]|uniref:DUF8009 domain-containing protein n=1 Tax=Halomarina halobia TaxID=3033386 RepID=A0ABD6A7W1_9EURY|nr:hypothetical protein [Halomarina sp. PSR21]
MSEDPTVVRSLAVTVDDLVAAYENSRAGRPTVLRVTPPYHARMRARLHVEQRGDPDALHVDPARLLDDDAPAYPTPEGTEDRLRESGRGYTTEAHHDLHVEAVAAWREAIREHVVDEVELETPEGSHRVTVKPLDVGGS